ncbi:MAG: NfeD family protein [Candidatus Bipolaricaulaceae bacterium]
MRTVVLLVAAWLGCALAVAGQGGSTVWVLSVDGEIGRGAVSYLQKGLGEAEAADAAAVVVQLATPGGYLDAAVAARDLLLDSSVPTIAFVNREAYSAGALLAIACRRIYFAPGGVMGAATPVYFAAGGSTEQAPEKVVSAVRALFRATAELRGRPPQVAEAMVDPDVAVEGLVAEGKLLTLTAQSAAGWGYSDGGADDLPGLLEQEDLAEAQVVRFTYRWVDRAVDVLTQPWLSGLLIAVGVGGLILELVVPGFGIFGILGLAGLGLFLWPHFLAGLAGWESVLFLLGGVVAILLELFVFTATDFGLAGLAGLVLVGLGFYTAMVGPFTRPDQATWAVGTVAVALVVALVATVAVLTRLPGSRLRLGGVILKSTVTGRAFTGEQPASQVTPWVGRRGTAITDLRPVGAAEFAGQRVEVVCQEGYLPKGTAVEVVEDQGYRKVVRRAKEVEA